MFSIWFTIFGRICSFKCVHENFVREIIFLRRLCNFFWKNCDQLIHCITALLLNSTLKNKSIFCTRTNKLKKCWTRKIVSMLSKMGKDRALMMERIDGKWISDLQFRQSWMIRQIFLALIEFGTNCSAQCFSISTCLVSEETQNVSCFSNISKFLEKKMTKRRKSVIEK